MKIISANAERMFDSNPLKHIEKIGRTCYKSEDKITEDSAINFITMLRRNNHQAMLEHFKFIVGLNKQWLNRILHWDKKAITITNDSQLIISFNARTINELLKEYDEAQDEGGYVLLHDIVSNLLEHYNIPNGTLFNRITPSDERSRIKMKIYDVLSLEQRQYNEDLTPEECKAHLWFTIKFTCDRGVSHEIVRHRVMSFAQESTRYCNYSKDRFGKELTYIKPCFLEKVESPKFRAWEKAMLDAENYYFSMIKLGMKPQEARSVLPNSLKTEICVTGTYNQWMHFFSLRCAPDAHPQMREVAKKAYKLI